jgi:hypothetical protein
MGRPGDEDVARSGAINAYLGELTDQNALRAQADKDMAAHNQQVDTAERGRQTAERALAIANTPGVSAYGRPIVGGNGSYATTQEPVPLGNPQQIASQMAPGQIAPPPPPKPVTFGKPEAAMVNGKRVFVREGSDGLMYDTARRPIDPAALQPVGDQNEPLVSIMGPDNRPILVRRSQAEGKTPASSREQGRPVTSGDAGRITELDTSLDDLAVLNRTLTDTAGATGTAAAVGAALPSWATEFTGWGTDAKKRQGVIDRVKQVIGKALEDGVLRKEDEVKYEKILPTIKDPQDVAVSKLNGLKTALTLRRQRTLESLADAGYETTRFEGRGGAPAGGGMVTLVSGDGKTERQVPADQVAHYVGLGAKVKQ